MDARLLALLRDVSTGNLAPEAAAARLAGTDLGFAVVDDDRRSRTGLPEVVYGEGKTPEQLVGLFQHLIAKGEKALATRITAEKAAQVAALDPTVTYDAGSRLLYRTRPGVEPFAATVDARVAIVCAGTSDLPVAEEAARSAEWFGLRVDRVRDVGVAGVHRLLHRIDAVREADVVIAVAGMEGALPSVLAGLVSSPVVAVPTSVGYGSNLGGIVALLAMLNSCAGGVSVVNIDNGFGAAQCAWRIASRLRSEPA